MPVEMTLGDFLKELASGKPTPSGGGAAAISASMAAALISMVCNLTIGRKKYKDVAPQMEEILSLAETLRKRFNQLADEDAVAFDELLSAFKLPHESEEEKSLRSQTIQDAAKRAAMVPLEVIRKCTELLPLANTVAEKGNTNAVSDAGVSALMLGAAAQSEALNVNINLMAISDRKWAEQAFDEMNKKLTEIRKGTEAVLKTVSRKMAE